MTDVAPHAAAADRVAMLWRDVELVYAASPPPRERRCHGFALVGGDQAEDRASVRLASELAGTITRVCVQQAEPRSRAAALLGALCPVLVGAPELGAVVVTAGRVERGETTSARAALAAWLGAPDAGRVEVMELSPLAFACTGQHLFLALARELPHVAHLHVFDAIARLERERGCRASARRSRRSRPE